MTIECFRIGFLVETQNVSIISNPGRFYCRVVGIFLSVTSFQIIFALVSFSTLFLLGAFFFLNYEAHCYAMVDLVAAL